MRSAGLAALNVAYAVVGLSLLWGACAFRTWGAPAPARGARVSARPRRVRRAVDGAARRRRARSGQSGSCSRSSSSQRPASCAGRLRGAALDARPCPIRRGHRPARHRRRASRSRGSSSRRCSGRRGCQQPPGVRRLGVLGAEGDGDLLLRRPGRARLHDRRRTRRTRRCSPILDAAAFHAMGGADVVDAARAVLVPRRRSGRGRRRAAPSARARLAPLAAASARPGRSALRRAAARALRPTSSSTCSSSSRPCSLALWLRDRRGWRLAAAAVLLAAGGEHEARGHPLRGVRARRRVRRLEARGAGPGSPRHPPSWSVHACFPGGLWAGRHDIGAGAPSSTVRQPTGSGARSPLVRRPLLECALVGAPSWSPRSRLPRRAVWGDGAWPRTSALLGACCCSPAASGRRSASRSSRSPPTRSGNPIVRYTGSIDLSGGRRRALAPGVGLARPERIRDRGLASSSPPRRSSRSRSSCYPLVVGADGARFPSVDDCVRPAPPGSTEPLDLVFGRRDTPGAAERLLARVRAVGYVDAEVRLEGCGRWKVLYDGITSYRAGRELRRGGARRRARGVARDSTAVARAARAVP